jgi:hypothetical protein
MGRHAPRRAQLVFTETAEQQIERLDSAAYARLDRALVTISLNPMVGEKMAAAPMLRQYVQGSTRTIFFATSLGSIVVVAYVEA